MLKLPVFEWELDCEPLGYPGLVVVMRLNPSAEEYEAPEKAQKWETPWYDTWGRIFLRVIVPAEYTDKGQELVIELPDGKAVYDLEHRPGFDAQILTWAMRRYTDEKVGRLEEALKN
jgi:hypothetical protein